MKAMTNVSLVLAMVWTAGCTSPARGDLDDPLVDQPPPADEPLVEPAPADDPMPWVDPPLVDPPVLDPPAEDPEPEDPPVEDPEPEERPVEDPGPEDPPVEDPEPEDPPVEDPPVEDPEPEEDPAPQWTLTAGPTGGSVKAVLVDPADAQVVYAGTVGGVYRSDDGGLSWTWSALGMTHTRVLSLAMDPDDGTLYAGTNGGVYISEDGAASWFAAGPGIIGLDSWQGGVATLLAVGDGVVYAGVDQLFRTVDAGDTWQQLGPLAAGIRSIHQTAEGALLAGTFANGIWRSTDDGATFVQAHPGKSSASIPYPSDVVSIVARPDGALIAAEYAFFNGARLVRSFDGGASWQTGTAMGAKIEDLVIHPTATPAVAYSAIDSSTIQNGDESVVRSPDGGKSWLETALAKEYRVETLAIDPQDPKTVFAAGLGLWRSTDSGATFAPAIDGLVASEVTGIAAAPGTSGLWVATVSQCLQRTDDGGATFETAPDLPCPGTAAAVATSPADPLRVHTSIDGKLFTSADGGASFAKTMPNSGWFPHVVADQTTPGRAWAGAHQHGVWSWHGPTSTWGDITVGIPKKILGLTVSATEPAVVYAAVNGPGTLYRRIIDADPTWEAMGWSLPIIPTGVAVHADTVYAFDDAGGLVRTVDAGDSWTALPTAGLQVRAMAFGPDGQLFAATPSGALSSEDDGATFDLVSDGLAPTHLRSLFLAWDGLYAGTVGGGLAVLGLQ